MDPALRWLLESEEPAVRYRALRELEGRPEADAEVRATRSAIPEGGWAARLLDGLAAPDNPIDLYVPKYVAPYHKLLVLADLGVPASHPRVAPVLARVLAAFAKPEGGFGSARPGATSHLCVTGNLTRALLQWGMHDDPRVARALDWLASQQLPDGGWHCWPDKYPHGTLDAWEALAAFAAVPAGKRTPVIERAIARGVEFLLSKNLGIDEKYAPWLRFHYPRHYYYDVLAGLDIVASLGHGSDPRLKPALELLRQKRDADGRWRLDAAHPDIEPFPEYEYAPHPPTMPLAVTPLSLETPGEPSQWITLTALRILRNAPG